MAYILFLLILTKNLPTIVYSVAWHIKICMIKYIMKNCGEERRYTGDMIFALMAKVSTKEFTFFDGFEVIEELYMVLNSTWTSCVFPITQKQLNP